MTHRISFLIVSLFCIPTIAQGMKIKNWDYKERDKGCIGYFLPKQENPEKYPYFLPEKDNTESTRSFLDELLFAKRMVERGLPEELAKEILYCSYLIEKTLDQDRMNRLERGLKVNKFDFFYLPMKSKRALLYVIDNGIGNFRLRIEGRDKEFAQKMSQYILDLPLSTRKEIAAGTDKYMICNTKYESSLYNTVLGEDDVTCDANKRRLTKIAKIATAGALTLTGIGVWESTDLPKDVGAVVFGATIGAGFSAVSSTARQVCVPDRISTQADAKENCVSMALGGPVGLLIASGTEVRNGTEMKEVIKPAALMGTGVAAGMFVVEGAGLYVSNKMENFLQESLEERYMRLGFEKIPLLRDDEK